MDRDDNYGNQLDFLIRNVLVKMLESDLPEFKFGADTKAGVLERERWIVEGFIEKIWDNLSDEEKLAILEEAKQGLIEEGIDFEKIRNSIRSGLGTMIIIRNLLGFKFHIFLAQIANAVARLIFGRGLSLAANAFLQRAAAFLLGPVRWIIMIILTIPDIMKLLNLNPREWDKYIPAILIIALYRTMLRNS